MRQEKIRTDQERLERLGIETKIEEEKKKQQELLENCIFKAQEAYIFNWNKSCEVMLEKADGCLLPGWKADSLEEMHQTLKNECFKKYPQR